MNYLAHIFLSGNNTDVMVGGFIADHLKGRMRNAFNGHINTGIKLHHAIDGYTDAHPLVESGKIRLRPHLHKYTPVVMDVYYDHFLAVNWLRYHDTPLPVFVQQVYQKLMLYEHVLPPRTLYMLGFMKQENWLAGYAHFNNLNSIFSNMGKRAAFDNNMHLAVDFLKSDYDNLFAEFEIFFESLQKMAQTFRYEHSV